MTRDNKTKSSRVRPRIAGPAASQCVVADSHLDSGATITQIDHRHQIAIHVVRKRAGHDGGNLGGMALDVLIRTLMYVAVGLVLLLCNLLFVRAIYSAATSPEFVIAPIEVVSSDPKEREAGLALAQMLQARLKTLEQSLSDPARALSELEKPDTATSERASARKTIPLVQVIPLSALQVQTSLLQVPDINVKVGGIEVNGLLPAIQRWFAPQQQLTFAIYSKPEGKKLVIGDVQPLLRRGSGEVWFDSETNHAEAIHKLALVVLQKRLAEEAGNRVEALTPNEFGTLVDSLVKANALVRQADLGRLTDEGEFRTLFENIEPLAEKVPEWVELSYFAGVLADGAQDYDGALLWYEAVQRTKEDVPLSTKVRDLIRNGSIKRRIEELETASIFPESDLHKVAEPSPAVDAAKKSIISEMEQAHSRYLRLFDQKVAMPKLIVLERFDNAYWDVEKNSIVVPLGIQYTPDIIYHEVAHPFVNAVVGSDFYGRADADAIVESYCDVLGAWVTQQKLNQTAKDADWTVGRGAVAWLTGGDPRTDQRPLRDMKTGSLMYPTQRRLASYGRGGQAEPHLLASLINQAFYEVSRRSSTDTAVQIWRDALPAVKKLGTVTSLRKATIEAAKAYRAESIAATVRAWQTIGVK
jgi:Thermolysin metallopeptidase, alpha-helical domain